MKVTSVDAYLLPKTESPSGWMTVKPLLYVKVSTDEGVIGWGEAYTLAYREIATMKIIEAIAGCLLERDPLDIDSFISMCQVDIAERRPGIDFFCAQSALEIALWDIVGKVHGRPVRELLGNVEHDSIMLYANCWSQVSKTVDEVVKQVQIASESGFSAVKLYPFMMSDDLVKAASATHQVCRAVSGEVEIFLDLSRRLDVQTSIDFVKNLRDAPIAWFEEPTSSRHLGQLAKINRQIDLPVVTGESVCGVSEFEPVISMGAADIINPDVAACGGLLELTYIAQMAHSSSIKVAPHNYNSMDVGLMATAQAAAIIPNFTIAEYFPDHALCWAGLSEMDMRLEAGFLYLGQEQGIGIAVDEAQLRSIAVAKVGCKRHG